MQGVLLADSIIIKNELEIFKRHKENRFLILYSLILTSAFSPIKPLGYLVNFILIGGLIFFVQVKPKKNLMIYSLIMLACGAFAIFYWIILPEFSFINYGLFLITFSSFLTFFFDFGNLLTVSLLKRMVRITTIFLIIENCYGLLQALVSFSRVRTFDGTWGDMVRGTIEPAFTGSSRSGSMVFIFLISTCIMFIIAVSRFPFPKRRLWVIGFTIVIWVLASAIHTIVFFVLAVALGILINLFLCQDLRIPKWLWIAVSIMTISVLAMTLLGATLLPQNFSRIPIYVGLVFDIAPEAPLEKSRSIYHSVYSLPKEFFLQPVVGLGPGQYSSRAALMMSGEYLVGGSLPFRPYASSLMEKYILELKHKMEERSHSSTNAPYFSWLTIYNETGMVGLMLMGFLVLKLIRNFTLQNSRDFPLMNISMLILLFYMLLLGFQENYWEYTQGIFLAFFLLAISNHFIKRSRSTPLAS